MEICMVVVHGKQRGKHLRFPEGEFVFGRGTECHIRPESPCVSRQHCLLRVSKEGVFVRDLSSTNGTLVNGVRIRDEVRLSIGDQLELGPLVIKHLAEVAVPSDWENYPPDSTGTEEYTA
jgi:pSer/pThr/pTyr-binding forkhead associated (FHA) protein